MVHFRKLLSGFVLITGLCSPALATDQLRESINSAADKIALIMKQHRLETATVLRVEDKTTLGATVLSGIEVMLKDALKKKSLLKDTAGQIGIRAEVLAVKTTAEFASANDRQLRINFKITDTGGEELTTFDGTYYLTQADQNAPTDNSVVGKDNKLKEKVTVNKGTLPADLPGNDVILTAFGGNSSQFRDPDATAGGNPAPPSNLDLLTKPTGVIVQDVFAKMNAQSPFQVGVIVNAKRKPLRMVDGSPFVDLTMGEKFQIELLNAGDAPVAAQIMIDGLNTFYNSQIPQKHGDSWILQAARPNVKAQPLVITGWYKNVGLADSFLATSFSQSKRKELGLGEEPIGAITVLFSNTEDTSQALPPKYEAATKVLPGEDGQNKTYSYRLKVEQFGGVYIGGGGTTRQVQGDVSKLKPADAIGTVTIRYRHPTVD
jgi:hypothetical protein